MEICRSNENRLERKKNTYMDNAGIITQSLMITLIGMVILFISLFILWGVMELLVRFLKDPAKAAEEAEQIEQLEVASVSEDELKMRAAAAAVASIQDYDLKMKIAAAAASVASVKK